MHTCCKQVKDFLDYGRTLHGEIQAYYDKLNEQTDKERIKMLLSYLSRHEQHMEESLQHFEQVTRRDILNIWLEHTPRLNIQDIIEQCALSAGMSLEDVVDLALKFDEALVRLYREVAEKAADARVKAVFQNIVAMEESEKQQMLGNANMLREM